VVTVGDVYTPDQHSIIAQRFLKQSCWLWPYFREAFVEGIVAGDHEYKDLETEPHKLTGEESRWLGKDAEWLQAKWKNNKAVELTPSVLLSVRTIVGIRHERDGKISKRWSTKLDKYPLSLVLSDPPVPEDTRFSTTKIDDLTVKFPLHSSAIMIDPYKMFGALCEIIEHNPPANIKVLIKERVFEPKFLKSFKESNSCEKYFSLNFVARKLEIVPRTLSKITASVKFEPGHHNFGLNIKFSGRNQQVLGYTRRRQMNEGVYGAWEYSELAIEVLEQYKKSFPKFSLL